MAALITVGIVARNEEQHIGETLTALGQLDFPREQFEVIVVDGDSSDRTREIAAQVLSELGISHKVLNEKDFGGRALCFARNLVIDQSAESARFIAYIDADCIADPQWLRALHDAMLTQGQDVAGVGGARHIAPTQDSMELVINAFLTSRIGSGFNPVFSNQPVEWVRSIANYNSLYRKDVLQKFRYDEALVISDDNEINYRITQAGLRFRFVREAKVLHRETNSVREFTRNMFSYGTNIANAVRKHRAFLRPTVPLTVGLLIYLLVLPVGYPVLGVSALLPLAIYALLAVAGMLEVLLKTRSPLSVIALVLLPLQHLGYGLGVVSNLLSRRVLRRA